MLFFQSLSKKNLWQVSFEIDVGYDSIAPGLATYGLSRNKWIDYFFNGCPVVCVYEGYQSMINDADFGSYVGYGEIKDLEAALESYRNLNQQERETLQGRGREYLLQEHSYPVLASKMARWISNVDA